MFLFSYLNHNGLCGRVADSNYFYTKESIPCMNFCVRVMPFVCMLWHGRNHACNLWRPVNTAYFGQNFIRYSGPLTWNSIPSALRNVESFVEFKSLVKKVGNHQTAIVRVCNTLEKYGKFHVVSFFLEKSGSIWKHLDLGWFWIFFSEKVWKMPLP